MDTAGSATVAAVVLFDEADLYLPAVRQPATKEPMENLLKRARSAGLSLLLATQSPGDFDYKCRDNIRSWLVGQVKEETALRKLKPMFSEVRREFPGRKAKAAEINISAVRTGHAWAEANMPGDLPFRVARMDATTGKILIEGNKAAALGALLAMHRRIRSFADMK